MLQAATLKDESIGSFSLADLSNWGCSIHEAIDSMPAGFVVVAQHKKTDLPYIVTGIVSSDYP